MQRPVLKHSSAGSWLWLCSSGIPNQPAKHGIVPADWAESPWAVPEVHRYRTHPDTAHVQALLLPRWGRCWDCCLWPNNGKTHCVPQTRARGAGMRSSETADVPSITQRESPQCRHKQEEEEEGGLLRAVSWLWQGCCHGLPCATPPPTQQGHQADSWQGFRGKKPSVRCTRLSHCCCAQLWITNIYKRETEAVLQAWPPRQSFLWFYFLWWVSLEDAPGRGHQSPLPGSSFSLHTLQSILFPPLMAHSLAQGHMGNTCNQSQLAICF